MRRHPVPDIVGDATPRWWLDAIRAMGHLELNGYVRQLGRGISRERDDA